MQHTVHRIGKFDTLSRSSDICRGGGIGIRARLKIVYRKARIVRETILGGCQQFRPKYEIVVQPERRM